MNGSEIGDVLKNPWVWGGGLALGVVILFMHNNSNGPSAQTSELGTYTQAAFAAQSQQVAVQGQLGIARINADATYQGQVLGFLSNLANVNAVVTGQLAQANAGIEQSALNTNAAIIIDQANNANRLSLADITAGIDYAQINEQWHASDNQLKAVKVQASAATTSSIFGSVAKLAGAFIGGPAMSFAGLAGSGSNTSEGSFTGPANSTLVDGVFQPNGNGSTLALGI